MDKSLVLLQLKQPAQKTNYPLIQILFLSKLPEKGRIRK
jgi:hypothetical protein